MSGKFITFEGGEGAGKSTQVERLATALRSRGINVVTTREPGGTQGAEAIRSLLVNGPDERWLPWSDVLLFNAARFDHVERVIKPALMEEKWVICDRFEDSTLAYQGYGKEYDRAKIRALSQLTLGEFQPDMTFIFDVDPEIGLKRAQSRDVLRRFETMASEFHHKLRAGFLEIAQLEPQRCRVIDASQTVDTVTATILHEISHRYEGIQ